MLLPTSKDVGPGQLPASHTAFPRRSLFLLAASAAAGAVALQVGAALPSDDGAAFAAGTTPPELLSVVRGSTSLDVRQGDLSVFPAVSRTAGGHLWRGVALSDLLDAVGRGTGDRIGLVSTVSGGRTARTGPMSVSDLIRAHAVVVTTRDGRTLPASGPVLLVTDRGAVPTAGRLVRIEVVA